MAFKGLRKKRNFSTEINIRKSIEYYINELENSTADLEKVRNVPRIPNIDLKEFLNHSH